MTNLCKIIVSLLLILCLGGCAGASRILRLGQKDTSVLVPGSSRTDVIAQLGQPYSIRTDEDGAFIDTWVINEQGVIGTTLDFVSLGLWDMVTKPLVGKKSNTTSYVVTYDKDYKIKEMKAFKE